MTETFRRCEVPGLAARLARWPALVLDPTPMADLMTDLGLPRDMWIMPAGWEEHKYKAPLLAVLRALPQSAEVVGAARRVAVIAILSKENGRLAAGAEWRAGGQGRIDVISENRNGASAEIGCLVSHGDEAFWGLWHPRAALAAAV